MRPGLYRLTKSMVNPFYEQCSHRELMGAIEVFPKDWLWFVHQKNPEPFSGAPDFTLMVIEAFTGQSSKMFVREWDYKKAVENYPDDTHLLVPEEFLEALVPEPIDTFEKVMAVHLHLHGNDFMRFQWAIEHLVKEGKLAAEDLMDACHYVKAYEREILSGRAGEEEDAYEAAYSTAVNEVLGKPGWHFID